MEKYVAETEISLTRLLTIHITNKTYLLKSTIAIKSDITYFIVPYFSNQTHFIQIKLMLSFYHVIALPVNKFKTNNLTSVLAEKFNAIFFIQLRIKLYNSNLWLHYGILLDIAFKEISEILVISDSSIRFSSNRFQQVHKMSKSSTIIYGGISQNFIDVLFTDKLWKGQ